MSMPLTVLLSIITIAIVLVLYRYVFNPKIVKSGSKFNASTCPSGWNHKDGLCTPSYPTSCSSFDPTKMTSVAQSCNLARTCGTDWPGMCP